MTVKTLHNHPIFHSEERLVNLVRGRECFVGLSTYCTTYIISLLWLSYCWPAWCDLQGVCGYSYMHCSTDWLARPEAVVLEILCIWRAVHREAALWIQNWHWTNHDIFLLYSTVLYSITRIFPTVVLNLRPLLVLKIQMIKYFTVFATLKKRHKRTRAPHRQLIIIYTYPF